MGSWLVLQGGERRLSVRSGAFVVEHRGEPVRTLRPQDVEEVHTFGDVDITPAARRSLLYKGIDVVFHTRDGRVQGRLHGQESRAGERRLAHLATALDPARRLGLARTIVAGKIANQRQGVSRIQRRARSEAGADALAALRAYERMAGEATGLQELRGFEGTASRAYFGVLNQGISNPLFTFQGRNRRPPRDPVNAILSFLYTLLAQRVESAAGAAGLDPFVGFLHDAGRGRAACAFDLMEEWRPMVDNLTLTIINRRQVAPEDFRDPHVDMARLSEADEEEGEAAPDTSRGEGSAPAGGAQGASGAGEAAEPARQGRAVYLGPVGRTIVLTTWARWLGEPTWSDPLQGRFSRSDLIRQQALALSRACRDEDGAYRPFRWS